MAGVGEVDTGSFLSVSLRDMVLEIVLALLKGQTHVSLMNDAWTYLHSYPRAKLSPISNLE
jgi:hypothetical protein